ncbi:MAG: hypothetical protein ACLR4Z_00915 [Butyricicoccaceae bacterium]
MPVENSLLLERSALRASSFSHEMHLFPHGVHGLALADMETAGPDRKGAFARPPYRPVAGALRGMAEGIKRRRFMSSNTANMIVFVLMVLLPLAAVLALEVFLSRRPSWWRGSCCRAR